MLWLKKNVIDYMEDDGFTRLDLAFDFWQHEFNFWN